LVHVYAAPNPDAFITAEGYVYSDKQHQAARDALTKLATSLQQDYPACKERFLIGEPAEEIALAAAKMGADLIVIASHQPSFLGRVFNLDQAPQIIRTAPCSVLVYHGNES
jgi:nucleotide-binding universal stress UspA family protein